MDMIKLTASARDSKASPKVLRRAGKVPCVLYGHATKNTLLQCEERSLHKAYVVAGESTLVELDMSDARIPVLFKQIDFDPVSGREEHVDFYAVDMKEEIEAKVPIHVEGEAPAVKDLGGILVTPSDHVTVRCLPADLPHALTVHLGSLVNFHDTITVAALDLPKGIKVMDVTDTVLATVQEPRKEEEFETKPATPVEGEAAAATEGETVAAESGATTAAAEEAAKTEKKGEKKK